MGDRRIDYRWYLLAVALLTCMLIVGMILSGFGLYSTLGAAKFELSRATMNTGLNLTNAGMALSGVFLSRLIGRLPLHPIMMDARAYWVRAGYAGPGRGWYGSNLLRASSPIALVRFRAVRCLA